MVLLLDPDAGIFDREQQLEEGLLALAKGVP